MKKWREVRLGEVCEKIGSGATPRGGKEAYHTSGISLIRSQNVLDFSFSEDGLVYIDEEQAGKLKNVCVEPSDVLLNITGDSVARACMVEDEFLPARVNQHVAIIRGKKDIILNSYILYFLQMRKPNLLMLSAGGATRKALTKQMIEDVMIPLPSLCTQTKIVKLLDDIQKRLQCNERINKNLEQQAQAIFKSWFVDFEPFDGRMPCDWSFGTLEDFGKEIICGKTPPTKRKEYYGGHIPFVTIPDMHNQVYITETERYLSNEGAAYQPTKTLPKNSICVSCIGTAGLVSMISQDSQTNQQINSIVPKESISPYYVYFLMKSLSETIIRLGGSGSTIVNLNKGQFAKIEATIPSAETMNKFTNNVSPFFDLILSNQRENHKLSKLRDALLPRLMSGEIDVSSVET